MAAVQPATQHAQGWINGRAVAFAYESGNEDDQGTLSWIERDVSNAQSTIVPVSHIIALVPTHGRLPNTYSLYYVVDNDIGKTPNKSSPVALETVEVTDPPQVIARRLGRSTNASSNSSSFGPSPSITMHIVVSTGSGTGLARPVWENLLKPLLEATGVGDQYQLHLTSSESSIAELAERVLLPQANGGKAQSVVLLSGDGGIVDLVNSLLASPRTGRYVKPAVSIIPVGTGNALAHSAAITRDGTFGARTLLHGSPKELPLFRATFSTGARLLVNEGREERDLVRVDGMPTVYGTVVCSWGLHATLVAESDTAAYRNFGSKRFQMAAKELLFPSDSSTPHAYEGEVSVRRPGSTAWQTLPRTEHGYVLATLVSHLEKGFTISPSSKPVDGKMYLVHFGPLDGQGATEIMTKAYQGGKHVTDERVGYEEIEGLRIKVAEEDERWRRVCVDGKIIRVETGGIVEVSTGVAGVVDLITMGEHDTRLRTDGQS